MSFVKYLDDSILLAESFGVCLENIIATVNLLRDLGQDSQLILKNLKNLFLSDFLQTQLK